MRLLNLLILTAFLVGCREDPKTEARAVEPRPEPPAPATPEPKPVDKGDNPQRIYQLRDLERVTLYAGAHKIPAWVMDTDSKRQEGMMFLTQKEVKDQEGMLFVFPDEQPRSFWMSNTILPLDIIYLNKTGKVLNIQRGKAYDETGLPSTGPAQYVLELKQGMGQKLRIRPGLKVTIPANVKAKG